MKCLRSRFVGNYFVGITSGGAGVTVSISLNFVSGRSRGAADSPVQQQETDMSAITDAQKAEKIRIMESKSKGLLFACGEWLARTWRRLPLPSSAPATKLNQKRQLLGGSHVDGLRWGWGCIRAAGNCENGTSGKGSEDGNFNKFHSMMWG